MKGEFVIGPSQKGSVKRSSRALALATVVASTLTAAPANAFSLIAGSGDPCTDVINAPDNFYSFDPGTITWKMDGEFLDSFPHPDQQRQVRLAFNEWNKASFSQIRRHPAAPYRYTRFNGERNFADLRSVVTHEVGHTLGSQHPDACWFNNDYNDNYRKEGQDWIAAPPSGGEIMNEGNGPGLPSQKPAKGLRGGEYWRIVSKDELSMLDYAYGDTLEFQEVFGDDADITLGMHNVGGSPGDNLGVGGPDSSVPRDEDNPLGGRLITAASATLNANPKVPIDFSARMSSWEFTNKTGKPIVEMALGISGTDNRKPIAVTSSGPHRFTQLMPVVTSTPFKPERLGRFLAEPQGGSVPDGSTVQFGLQEDVWDWNLVHSRVKASDGSLHPAGLVAILDFGFAAPGPEDKSPPSGDVKELEGLDLAESPSAVSGFKIRNANFPTIINQVVVALPDKDLGLSELNRQTMQRLESAGRTTKLDVEPLRLKPAGEFYFILDGDAKYLPEDVRRRGNYKVLRELDFADRKLLVFASAGREHSVRAYSVLGDSRFSFEDATIDVTPSDPANRISCNPRSEVSVAILTDYGFDATNIDAATLEVGQQDRSLSRQEPKTRLQDVDGDGDLDLIAQLPLQGSGVACSQDRLMVSGLTKQGRHFAGVQSVTMVR